MKHVLAVEGYVVIRMTINSINAFMATRWGDSAKHTSRVKVEKKRPRLFGASKWQKQIRSNTMERVTLGGSSRSIGSPRNLEDGSLMILSKLKRQKENSSRQPGQLQAQSTANNMVFSMFLSIRHSFRRNLISFTTFLLWMNHLQWKVTDGEIWCKVSKKPLKR